MSAKFPFECPACHRTGKARLALMGSSASCKACGGTFTMPRHLRLACPSCQKVVRVAPKYLDRRVTCTFCEDSFQARLADAVPATSHPLAAVADGPPEDGDGRSGREADRLVGADAARRSRGARPDRVEPLESETPAPRDRTGEACQERGRADALRVGLLALRAELEAFRTEAEGTARRRAEELEGLRAERDSLEARLRADAAQAERLRADSEEYRRLLDEAIAGHRAEVEGLVRLHDGERSRWGEEQLALESRHRDELEMLRGELERRRSPEEDEVQGGREWLAAHQRDFERERQALTGRSEQLLHELERSRRDHREALEKVDELGCEASRLADQLAAADAAHSEELGRLRGEDDLRCRGHERALHRIDELEREASHRADELSRQEAERQDEIRRLLQEGERAREERERALRREKELESELAWMADERGREADRHRGEVEDLLRRIEALRGDFQSAQQLVASVRRERERAAEERDAEVGRLRREIEAGDAELEVARRQVEELERGRERAEAERRAEVDQVDQVDQLHARLARLDADREAARAAEQEARRRSDALAADRDQLRAERDRLEEEGRASEQRSGDERDRLIQQLGRAREEAAQHGRRAEAMSGERQKLASELDGLRASHESELRKIREQLQIALRRGESAAAERPRAEAADAGGGANPRTPSASDAASSAASGPPPESREVAAYRDLALGQWSSDRFKKFLELRRGAKAETSSVAAPRP